MSFKAQDDIDYDDCYDSECEGECVPYKGCTVGLTLGPCNALDTANGEIDLSQHCQLESLTSLSLNPDQEINVKQYLGTCYERTTKGAFRYSIDISTEICEQNAAMCQLLNYGCLVSWCLMPRSHLFDPTLPASQQPGIFFGQARVGSGGWDFNFSDEQAITATLTGHGKLWRYGLCASQPGLVETPLTEGVPLAAQLSAKAAKKAPKFSD